MKRHFSDYLIALSVIACSAVLLFALSYALRGSGGKSSKRTLSVDFIDITGVRLRSELRYAGAPAGSVSAIRLLTPEERQAGTREQRRNAVRVTVELVDGVPAIPSDTKASISSDSMLSEKFIALSGGTPDVPLLADGAILQGQSGTSIDDLLASMGPMMKTAETALGSIEPLMKKTSETLDSLKDGIDEVMPKVGKVTDAAETAAASADALLKRADKLITDNEGTIKADLLAVKEALTNLQTVLKSTDGFVTGTDRQLAARMRELSVVLQNLKVVSTHAKALAKTVGERPHRLIFGGKPLTLSSEEEILRSEKPVPAVRTGSSQRDALRLR